MLPPDGRRVCGGTCGGNSADVANKGFSSSTRSRPGGAGAARSHDHAVLHGQKEGYVQKENGIQSEEVQPGVQEEEGKVGELVDGRQSRKAQWICVFGRRWGNQEWRQGWVSNDRDRSARPEVPHVRPGREGASGQPRSAGQACNLVGGWRLEWISTG